MSLANPNPNKDEFLTKSGSENGDPNPNTDFEDSDNPMMDANLPDGDPEHQDNGTDTDLDGDYPGNFDNQNRMETASQTSELENGMDVDAGVGMDNDGQALSEFSPDTDFKEEQSKQDYFDPEPESAPTTATVSSTVLESSNSSSSIMATTVSLSESTHLTSVIVSSTSAPESSSSSASLASLASSIIASSSSSSSSSFLASSASSLPLDPVATASANSSSSTSLSETAPSSASASASSASSAPASEMAVSLEIKEKSWGDLMYPWFSWEELEKYSPSRQNGITWAEEKLIRRSSCDFIVDVGTRCDMFVISC
jgi:hypothetical protein